MFTYAVGNAHIKWIPVGGNCENFTNSGNYPLIWICNERNPLHILVASVKASTKTLTEGVKRALAHNGHSIKNPEKEKIAQWLKNVRFTDTEY